ncbi:Calx-beta domain-containing protein [Dehalogenimonas etheniformans]|uniref:Calx-beta domain-containing protein n=1 Tax=Dehalogenimonas etheniformans TaxID=1536648 RepID=A0A2P5P6Y3_9CHLR|nr:Calx-beta domain-containing protein [Dehalogenimonas etheniformans]PPD58057.1 hypothetical protein JP09_007150 [Dehalogenimonas etheniformans]QNT75407.1 hypothetical protein HX448_01230 [Dehalogenimonas etheniformans]
MKARILMKLGFLTPLIMAFILLLPTTPVPVAAADLPGEPIERHPTGFLDFTGSWTRNGGEHGWDCVDEYPPDDDDYVKAGETNDENSYMLFRYASFGVPNYTDANVTIFYRARDNDYAVFDGNNIQSSLQIGGLRYHAGSHNPPGTNIWGEGDFTTFSYTWDVNPATGQEWVGGEITQIQGFGVYTNDAQPDVRVSAVWMVINFTYVNPYVKFEYANPHQSEAAPGEMGFGIVLSNASTNTITVNYSVTPGTATPGVDYNASSGSVTFLPGETRKSVRGIYHLNDQMYEGPETIIYTLSNPVNALLGAITTATWTIDDDDPEIYLEVIPVNAIEGNSGPHTVPVTINIWGAAAGASTVSVNYATADGTAMGSGTMADYAPVSGTLTFMPGQTSKTINITVSGDKRYESDEYFWLNLSNFVGASLNYFNPGGVMLRNDDTPPVINEFVADHAGDDTYEYIEIYGAPATDYSDFKILIVENDPGENPGVIDRIYNVGTTDAQGFWRTPFLHNELENGSFNMFLVSGFTGTLGQDLDANNDRDSEIKPWNTLLQYDAIAVYNPMPTEEFFYPWPTLFDAGGGSRLPNGTGAWVKNDFDGAGLPGFAGTQTAAEALNTPGAVNARCSGPPTVQFTIATSNGFEAANANLTVNLTPSVATTVTVQYSVTGGTAGGSGVDYTPASGTLTFAPGVTSQNIPITVAHDSLDEPNETIVVSLSSPVNAVLGAPTTHTYTINDDDAAPLLSINDVTVTEGGNAVFTVTLSAPSGNTVSVHYDTISGTAVIGSDCNNTLGILNFNPGSPLTRTITEPTIDDSVHEEDENFIIRLSTASGANITKQDGIGTIIDNDAVAMYTVTFEAGSNGSLSGTATFSNVPYNTSWASTFTVPTPVPAAHFHFVDWTPSFPSNVTESVTYTANFAINTFGLQFFAGLPPSAEDGAEIFRVTIGDGDPVSVTCGTNGLASGIFSDIPYGTSISFICTSPVANIIPGYRNPWTGTSGTGSANGQVEQTGSFSLTGPSSVTATYGTEYKVTYASSPAGLTVPTDEWVKSGEAATGVFASPQYNSDETIKYVFITDNRPDAITGPRTIAGTYTTQYYLTVNNGGHGTAGGQGWYEAGAKAQATISPLTVIDGTIPYIFAGWSGDASGTGAISNDITMNAPKTATANWTTQCQVTFHQSGLPADTLWGVSLDGEVHTGTGADIVITGVTPGVNNWLTGIIESGFTRYVPTPESGSPNITENTTINVTFETQFLVIYMTAGSTLPVTPPGIETGGYYIEWVPGGHAPTGVFPASVHNEANNTRCVFQGDDRPATITTGLTTVTGTYKTQYLLTIASAHDSPTGAGWHDSGASVTVSVTTPADTSGVTRYRCTGWTGTGSVLATGSGNSVTFDINGPSSITWNWVLQYQITFAQGGITADAGSAIVLTVNGNNKIVTQLQFTDWYDHNSTITFAYNSTVAAGTGKQYIWASTSGLSTSQSGNLSPSAGTVLATYHTQYQLNVAVTGGVPGGTANITGTGGWYAPDTNVSLSAALTVGDGTGHRWRFDHWTVVIDGTPVDTSQQEIIVPMRAPVNATAYYVEQYQVTVISAQGTPTGAGWYDAGASITSSVTTPVETSGSSRYRCTGWTGTGSVPASGNSNSTTFNLTASSSVTWNWVLQYQVTFAQGGVGTDADTSTVLTINGVNKTIHQLQYSDWYDYRSTIDFAYSATVAGATGKQYVWGSTSGLSTAQNNSAFTVSGPGTVVANYGTQYLVTFTQAGISSDAGTNTVLTVGTTDYDYLHLPSAAWLDSGTTFSWASPVEGTTGERFVKRNQSGSSPITAAGTYSATYGMQYLITFAHTGLDNTATGVVVDVRAWRPSVNGKILEWQETISGNFSDTSYWVNDFNEISYEYHSVIASSSAGKRFVRTSGDDPSSNFHPESAVTITGNYTTQYRLTMVGTGTTDPSMGEHWIDAGTSVTITATAPAIVDGERYVWNSWDFRTNPGTPGVDVHTYTDNPYIFTINAPTQAGAQWWHEYRITFTQTGLDETASGWVLQAGKYQSSPPPVDSFYRDGYFGVFEYWVRVNWKVSYNFQPEIASTTSGKRFVVTSPVPTPATDFLVTGPVTITANYKTQYQLSVSTNLGTTSPNTTDEHWYDAGAKVTLSATPPSLTYSGQERYVFNGWTGSGTGSYSGTDNPATDGVTVNGPITETASWTHEWHIYFGLTGVDDDFTGAILTADGTGYGYSDFTHGLYKEFWWADGTSHSFEFHTPLVVEGAGKRYVWNNVGGRSWSGTVSIYGGSAGRYKTQYQLTLSITEGVPGSLINLSGGADSTWYDSGTALNLSAATPVADGAGKRWAFKNWTGDVSSSPNTSNPVSVTMTQARSITANYGTQYQLTLAITEGVPGNLSNVSGAVDGTWYDNGTALNLSAATPVADGSGKRWAFKNWTGDVSSSPNTSNPVSVTMNQARSITAKYGVQYQLTLVVSPTEHGVSGSIFGAVTGDWIDSGTTKQLTANPNSQWHFWKWTGDIGSATATVNPLSITIDAAKSVTANFKGLTSLLYIGTQEVVAGNSLTLSAKLTGPAGYIGGQTITFTFGSYTRSGITDSSGVASVTINDTSGMSGIYDLYADFAGSNYLDAAGDEATLTIADPGAAAAGGGWYTAEGIGRVNFGFTVKVVDPLANPLTYKGQILLINNGKWRLKGDLTSYVYLAASSSGACSGTGTLYRWDATARGGLGDWVVSETGVTFTISFVDNGSGASGNGKKVTIPDTFGIHINHVLVSGEPVRLPNTDPQSIGGGNIDIKAANPSTTPPPTTNPPKGGGKK